ncbi:MAG: VWA domain-containing protein [Candidatus Eisenbacteria bacterium]|nr:VWA domain-containing protein [Candidatus Eisenbacteria bacterium]
MKRFSHDVFHAIAALAATLFFFGTIQAQEPATQIELIFDASGSMWGEIGGVKKIAMAREAMGRIVDDLATRQNIEVGLRVYGHRTKSCDDSELVLPIGPVDAGALRAFIDEVNPKGKTPITYSLLEAIDDFRADAPGRKVVVLITDGLESCDGDPCEAARKLSESGVVTKTHVVGFGLDENALATLRCIVEPSGGLLVGAGNTEELAAAFDRIVARSLAHNLEITAVNDTGSSVYMDWDVFPAGDESAPVASGDNSLGNRGRAFVPEGTYDIRVESYETGDEIWFRGVEVVETDVTVRRAIFAERTIEIALRDGASGESRYGDVILFDGKGERLKMGDTSIGGRATFTVLPGVYEILVVDYDTKKEFRFSDVDLTDEMEFRREVVVE